MRELLSKIMIRTVQFICRINAPFSIKKMTERACEDIISKARVGDILLVRTEGELTTAFQPEYWTHAALVLTDKLVVEATTKGVRLTDIMYVVARVDDAALYRPDYVRDQSIVQAEALKMVNMEYDYEFKKENARYYCFELVAELIRFIATKSPVSEKKTILGKKWLASSFTHFERIA